MNRILFSLLILISLQSFSQNPEYVKLDKTFGGSDYDGLISIIPTQDGGYLLGGITGSNDGDIQSGNHGAMDYWIVKIDSLYNIQWEKTYGGSQSDNLSLIHPTVDGKYILGGYTWSIDGDVHSENHGGDGDIWIVMINNSGDIIWERTYGGSKSENVMSIITTSDGGYLLGGHTDSNDGDVGSKSHEGTEFWIIKINGTGDIQWEKTYGGNKGENIYSLQLTSDNGFLLGGRTGSNDGDIQSGYNGGGDWWVVKTDNSGNIEWEKTYGGSENDWLYSSQKTNDNGFILGGNIYSNDGDIQSGNHGGYDYWIVRIDSTGSIQWEKTLGGTNHESSLTSIQLLNNGDYLLGGGTQSSDGDVESGNHGEGDYWVVNIDDGGNIIWEKTYGGSNREIFTTLLPTLKGNFILGGTSFSNNGDIQSGNKGSSDFWILEIGINSPPTGINLSNYSIKEDIGTDSIVGYLTSIDQDRNEHHSYSLVPGDGDSDNSKFIISGNNLLTNSEYDYETKLNYNIRIQSQDIEGNTFSNPFIIHIENVNDLYLDNVSIKKPNCSNQITGSIEFDVREFIPPLSFLWSTGDTSQNIYNQRHGNYSVTIIDGDSMVLTQNFEVTLESIYEGTSICYVTANRESNVINIDKGLDNFNVEKYLLFREGVSQNNYEKIGEIICNENYFIDSLINNRTQSFSYKVSMIDSCGNESPLSSNHNTVHLSQNRGTSGEVNLYWTHYVGLNVPSYSIYRQKGNQEFELLKQISTSNNTYTDFTSNPSFNYQYYISFNLEDTCYTEVNLKSGENIEVKSNTTSTDSTYTGIPNFTDSDYKIYPNPVNDKIIVEISNPKQIEFILYDLLGNIIIERNLESNKNEIDINSIASGAYSVQLRVGVNIVHQQKIIKQ